MPSDPTAAGRPTSPPGGAAAPERWRLLGLLLATGGLIGAFAPLARIATAAGVPPLAYAFWLALGGGLVLMAAAVALGRRPPFSPRHLRYYLVSALVSFVLPNTLLAAVVSHLGAGLASIVFTLPPALTYALALALGLERPRAVRAGGIALGLAGAAMILLPRGGLPDPDLLGWMALALVIPAVLAVGNVYRSLDWPPGAAALPLAAGMLLTAALLLALPMLLAGQGRWPFAGAAGAGDWALLAQVAVTPVSYLLFFELQRRGGPVMLSQIGYVITMTGVVTGLVLFDERFTAWIWAALALMVAGLALVNRRPRRPSP